MRGVRENVPLFFVSFLFHPSFCIELGVIWAMGIKQ